MTDVQIMLVLGIGDYRIMRKVLVEARGAGNKSVTGGNRD